MTATDPEPSPGPPTSKAAASVWLESRVNGPRDSANGGFACGTIAGALGGSSSVRLHRPVPLEERLAVDAVEEGIAVHDQQGRLVATAHRVEPFVLAPPTVPTFDAAQAASAAHPLRGVRHALSDCVVCGPDRPDGLRVTPGPLVGHPGVLAAPFVPTSRDATAGVAHLAAVWGALDCPSYPAEALVDGTICLLGTLTAHVQRDLRLGERFVAVGWTLERRDRTVHTASALVDDNGITVASAWAVWVKLEQP